MSNAAPLLEARNLTKRFGAVTALDGVSFTLRAGEIHALCGENGAGKSTLIKTLSGIYPHGSYSGELLLNGQPAAFRHLRDAADAGIAVIHQELALVENLTVAENIFLGREPRRGPWVDHDRARREAAELLGRFAISIDPALPVSQLGVGQKQLVEIVRALSRESRILILDEPTAALADTEVAVLMDILLRLRAQGVSIIYISHKLPEVQALADRITILRDGAAVATMDAAPADAGEIIRHMVGREISSLFPRQRPAVPGPVVLRVDGLNVGAPGGSGIALRDIRFEVRQGEVLGIGGLMGAGRSELLQHLFAGWGTRLGGVVSLNGDAYPDPSPATSLQRGLAMVTEDRKRYGLHLDQSTGWNLTLSSLRTLTKSGGLLDTAAAHAQAEGFLHSLQIKAPGLDTPAGTLSGGNQQKIVIGKALGTCPSLLFLDEPTRGIDVGARLEIYHLINSLTAQGMAVVMVSSELPELMGMSDRILMLHEGTAGGSFQPEQFTQAVLMAAAMGRAA